MSVRFNEGAVVRNAMQKNDWGREEREGTIPIIYGEMLFFLFIKIQLFNYYNFGTSSLSVLFDH